MTKPSDATHRTKEDKYYRKSIHDGKTWWYVYHNDWFPISGNPSEELLEINHGQIHFSINSNKITS